MRALGARLRLHRGSGRPPTAANVVLRLCPRHHDRSGVSETCHHTLGSSPLRLDDRRGWAGHAMEL